jgi:hypothetical protein
MRATWLGEHELCKTPVNQCTLKHRKPPVPAFLVKLTKTCCN